MAAFSITVGDGSSYESVVAATSGLVSRYKMGETSGTTITDDISGYNGTISGSYTLNQAGLLGGGAGKAIRFTDTSRVTVGSTNALSGATSFSIELLVQIEQMDFSSASGWTQRLVEISSGSGASQRGFFLSFQRNGADTAEQGGIYLVGTYYDSTGTPSYHVPNRRHNTDHQSHVVVTYNATTSLSTIYVNGRAYTSTRTMAAIPSTTLYLMGRSSTSGIRGRGSQVAIYNRVLTAQEAMDHYSAVGEFAAGAVTSFARVGARPRSPSQEVIGTDERVSRITNPGARSSSNTSYWPTASDSAVNHIATTNFADGPGGELTRCFRLQVAGVPAASNFQLMSLQGGDSTQTNETLANLRSRGWTPVRPGQQLAVSFYAKADSTVSVRAAIYYRNSNGVWVTNANGTTQTATAGTWTLVTDLFTVPASAEWAMLYVQFLNLTTGTTAYDFRTTGHLLEANNRVDPYFDGSSPGARWFGTADQSSSGYPLARTSTTGSRGQVNIGIADTYKQRVVTDGAIARWGFDEESGTTAQDDIGGRTLTLNGTENTDFRRNRPPLIAGVGKALALNGTANGHALGSGANNPLLNLSSWTIEMVVRSDRFSAPTDANYGTIGLLNAWQNDVSTTNQGVSIYWGGNTSGATGQPYQFIAVEIGTGTTLIANTTQSLGTLAGGQVFHVVATFGGGVLALYVNGRLAQSRSGQSYSEPTAGTLRLGLYSSLTGNKFLGAMDEFAVYNSALTAAQVRDHYERAGVFTGGSNHGRRTVADSRLAGDIITVGEITGRQIAFPRPTSDFARANETTGRQIVSSRPVTDSFGLSDAVIRLANEIRNVADATVFADLFERELDLIRGYESDSPFSDDAEYFSTLNRTLMELVDIKAELTRLTGAQRQNSSLISLIDFALRGFALERGVADDLNDSDFVDRNFVIERLFGDHSAIDSSAFRSQTFVRGVGDLLNVDDETLYRFVEHMRSLGYFYANQDGEIKYLIDNNELAVSALSDTEFILHRKAKAQSNRR